MKIVKIISRQILDSRGDPTIETDVYLENGIFGRASVPSGKSTGKNEALELRDGDPLKYQGKGVLKAVDNVTNVIAPKIIGIESDKQPQIDEIMISLDGTENKSKLGANAILSVSLAASKAAAKAQNLPFYVYLNKLFSVNKEPKLPMPMINILNGGAHANFVTDIQEYMIVPVGAENFTEALQISSDVFHSLGRVLKEKGYATLVGDEGGYAPKVKNGDSEAIELIMQAVEKAGYKLGVDFAIAIDVAASQLYKNGTYTISKENKQFDSSGMIGWLSKLIADYPIVSVEDGLAEDDWDSWVIFTGEVGDKVQVVGDDLLVTNTRFIQKAIDTKAVNAVLIKPNQIGTLTETANAIKLSQQNNLRVIVSHRSGETEDTTISHIVVAFATGQIKTGSLSRSERNAKYNELLRISETLSGNNSFTLGLLDH
ncbi:MAG: Enolase [Candidatus Woesebacteria bacterium GW2011_GWA1_39_8]|uniref:Enolase n=1 Tax=Candidatus Woesebacteria bacterium GW2011_GWA1_39_8 TaxID=1618552 RepID=A0A0G0SVK3_9BACT|nr:MAG: Enolase [Candidatus Woesebacteria bacterium GW2011_GWA1_39_8]